MFSGLDWMQLARTTDEALRVVGIVVGVLSGGTSLFSSFILLPRLRVLKRTEILRGKADSLPA